MLTQKTTASQGSGHKKPCVGGRGWGSGRWGKPSIASRASRCPWKAQNKVESRISAGWGQKDSVLGNTGRGASRPWCCVLLIPGSEQGLVDTAGSHHRGSCVGGCASACPSVRPSPVNKKSEDNKQAGPDPGKPRAEFPWKPQAHEPEEQGLSAEAGPSCPPRTP